MRGSRHVGEKAPTGGGEVVRVHTSVQVVKEELVKVGKQKRLVPARDAGIYVLGGCILNATVAYQRSFPLSVQRYDANEGKWEDTAGLSCPRDGCNSAVIGDTIYAIGGYTGTTRLRSVESFSARTKEWRSVAPMPTERCYGVAGVVDCDIYVAGGCDDKSTMSSVIRFDAKLNQWHEVASMTCPRLHGGGAVLQGFFYVVGGKGNGWPGRSWNTVEKYDPVRKAWGLVAPMSTERNCLATAVLNGGKDQNDTHLSSVERYDPTTNSWEQVASMSCVRPLHNVIIVACASLRYGPSAAVLDGRLYVMGGCRARACLSSVERYDEVSDRWEMVSDMLSPRYLGCTAVAM
eukprot:g10369.t1